jgi:hypothetical protein
VCRSTSAADLHRAQTSRLLKKVQRPVTKLDLERSDAGKGAKHRRRADAPGRPRTLARGHPPAVLILPRPKQTEYSELKNSIEVRGVLTPLATYIDAKGDHWLLGAVSRLQVMVELDKPVLDVERRWAIPTTP